MYHEFCDFCDKQLPYAHRIDARFCSEQCKVDYFNEKRKLIRAKEAIMERLNTINDFCNAAGILSKEAYSLIETINQQTVNLALSYVFRCRQCGQLKYQSPVDGETCHYCNSDDWIIVPSQRMENKS